MIAAKDAEIKYLRETLALVKAKLEDVLKSLFAF